MRFDRGSDLLVYQPKAGPELDDHALTDPLELLARVLIHVPDPHKHLVHFYGPYANRIPLSFRNHDPVPESVHLRPPPRALSKKWRELIYRIYEVDPLTCTRCGAEMKISAFITDH